MFQQQQMFQHQQQMFMGGGMAGTPYMTPGNVAGMYGMPATPLGAAAAGGFGAGWGNQSSGLGGYDPQAAAARRAAWAATRGQRSQPSQPSRQHKPHRCHNCWQPLKGQTKLHEKGLTSWEHGGRCRTSCAACGKPMADHQARCPDPDLKK
jgi:hypothetical protein